MVAGVGVYFNGCNDSGVVYKGHEQAKRFKVKKISIVFFNRSVCKSQCSSFNMFFTGGKRKSGGC